MRRVSNLRFFCVVAAWCIPSLGRAFLTSPTGSITPAASAPSRTPSATQLFENKLWNRLKIEEDPEAFWYLLNCVATNELDLLYQCRTVCADMPDAIKFVVPLEQKTRSHGAKKMVTETKVKYAGYVFAKLRLCPEVYEAIQSLDLCRSWMGTVNHKGYRKLPPVPVALNELEIENFGLEEMEETELDDQQDDDLLVNEDGVILDSDEDDDDDDDMFQDPMYKNVDMEAIKQYKGLRVDDMVKVITKNKFYNEDGIVRRLKDGFIFVRFYTYGTLFEEWLDPGDVRKLTAEEIQRGLGGPSEPITQRDIDRRDNSYSRDFSERRPGDLRQNLTGSIQGGRFGGGQQRNRRQDRAADRFRSSNDYQTRREEKNWNWYKDEQKRKRGSDYKDGDWRIGAGSKQVGQRKWAQGDVDSQWGRTKSQRQERRERQRSPQHQADLRDTMAAIDGKDDWSSFVTSSKEPTEKASEADDFFASLMTDLDKDLGGSKSSTGASGSSSQSEDDFFASLLTEIADSGDSTDKPTASQSDNEAFFASLEAELSPSTTGKEAAASPDRSHPPDQLQADLDSPPTKSKLTGESESDDFFDQLERELASNDFGLAEENSSPGTPESSADDFFDQLQADLANESFALDNATPSKTKSPKPSSSSGGSMEKEDLSKKTVPILKEMLRDRGLKVSGKKADLIDRLVSS